jgi:hypothetical protein
MIGSRWRAVIAAVGVAAAGCGGKVVLDVGAGSTGTGGAGTGGTGTGGGTSGNPLVGYWSGGGGAPTVLSELLIINAAGTASAVDTFSVIGDGSAMCKGELDVTTDWTSTATTISFSVLTCAGQVVCPNGEMIPCGPQETTPETCTYTLSNGDATLELDCPEGNGPLFFTRQP